MKKQKTLGQIAYEAIQKRMHYVSWSEAPAGLRKIYSMKARAVEREVWKRVREKYPNLHLL